MRKRLSRLFFILGLLMVAAAAMRAAAESSRYPRARIDRIDVTKALEHPDCVEVLKPWQVEEMTCAGWDLTLFTCTATGRARFAVRCVRDGL